MTRSPRQPHKWRRRVDRGAAGRTHVGLRGGREMTCGLRIRRPDAPSAPRLKTLNHCGDDAAKLAPRGLFVAGLHGRLLAIGGLSCVPKSIREFRQCT